MIPAIELIALACSAQGQIMWGNHIRKFALTKTVSPIASIIVRRNKRFLVICFLVTIRSLSRSNLLKLSVILFISSSFLGTTGFSSNFFIIGTFLSIAFHYLAYCIVQPFLIGLVGCEFCFGMSIQLLHGIEACKISER